MIWLPLLIPVLFTIAVLIFFKEKMLVWEPFIPLAATLLIIIIFRYVGITSLTKDYEYWGNYVTEVRHYEDWDEWISQTCTESYACGTDSKGNTQYCTRTYDCSYRRYHPDYWTLKLNSGEEIDIEESYYKYLQKRFGSKDLFVDMDRDYYHQDGDMYKTLYQGTYDSYEFYASKHSYENRVQASTSIFNYPEVSDKEIAKYRLYSYPDIKNDRLQAILSPPDIKINESEQRKFDYINGIFGQSKKVRVWVCLFNTSNDKAGSMQEALWKRGNKNELVTCIGIDKDRNIKWVHVFGWSKKKIIEIEVRDYILAQKKLNLLNFGDFMYKQVEKNWVKTSFKDFKYLAIEPPAWAFITIWLISILACIGIFWWIIVNEFKQ